MLVLSDADVLLPRIGRHSRTRKTVLRLGLKWTSKRLNTALDELDGDGRISITEDGVVRTLALSEPAERVLNALPATGESRSGRILIETLGMTADDLGRARRELKDEQLVISTSGRGNGTLAAIDVAGSREEERLKLLAEELRLAADVVPDREVLEELFHACYIEPHEGAYPSYGALVVDDDADPYEALEAEGMQVLGDPQEVDELRSFADGMNSFVLRRRRSNEAELVLTPEFRGLEFDVVQLAEIVSASVVQRNRAGVVRLMTADTICIRESGVWKKKTTSLDLIDDILIALGDVAYETVAQEILDLCLHVLSPNHVGATLVWAKDRDLVTKTGANRISGLGWGKAFQPPPLDVTEERHIPLVLHSLAHVDRAAIMNAAGELLWLGVNLEPTNTVNVEGGTRHNSAAAFSFEHDDVMVFVVSADGPVTVFYDGAVIRTTRR